MWVVGLTGGIASGKTTVAEAFADLGVEVIDTDELAREVVAPGGDGLSAVVSAFGDDVLQADGTLDRSRLRQLVFDDPAARERLERLLHPRIARRVDERVATARGPYVILVVPLLVEKDWGKRVNRTLVVDVPTGEQLHRLCQRDGISPEQARRMVEAQASRERRLAIADDVIDNTREPPALLDRVHALDRLYRQLSR